jgi:hypothetical protein
MHLPDRTQIVNISRIRVRPNTAADLEAPAGISDVSPPICNWYRGLLWMIVVTGGVVVYAT